MEELFIHPHALKHGISETEICEAWSNFIAKRYRDSSDDGQVVCVGFSSCRSREIQLIGIQKDFGVLIYHAMSPAQEKILRELEINKRGL